MNLSERLFNDPRLDDLEVPRKGSIKEKVRRVLREAILSDRIAPYKALLRDFKPKN